MEYLRNSKEIGARLQKLFGGQGRKVAIVGFVGSNALKHLPEDISGLEVVCWPKAGATHPDGIRQLLGIEGVSVSFCDNLHQKIYWREGTGLIVGSANLSENGLGDGGLHEFAVYCADRSFDIDRVLNELSRKPVSESELSKLTCDHWKLICRTKRQSGEGIYFTDYLGTGDTNAWKIVTASEELPKAKVNAAVKAATGTVDWNTVNEVYSDKFETQKFVLQVETDGKGRVKKANANWMYAELIVDVDGTPCIVQRNKLNRNKKPPFKLDNDFKKYVMTAFNTARISKSGENQLDKKNGDATPLIHALRLLYGNATGQ